MYLSELWSFYCITEELILWYHNSRSMEKIECHLESMRQLSNPSRILEPNCPDHLRLIIILASQLLASSNVNLLSMNRFFFSSLVRICHQGYIWGPIFPCGKENFLSCCLPVKFDFPNCLILRRMKAASNAWNCNEPFWKQHYSK